MRRLRKWITLTLTAAMAVSMLAGCSKENTTEDNTEIVDTSEVTEEITEEITEEATEEETSGVADGDVIIDLTFDEDVDGFHTYLNGGSAEISSVDGEMCVDIMKVGTLDYANQVYYDGFALYQDCVYRFSFDVRCDIERDIEWRLQINGGDYHAYVNDVITIGPDTQRITAEFTMAESSDPAPRLCFNMGKAENMESDTAEHFVYFDNILLEVVDASGAQQIESIPEPMPVKTNQIGYLPTDSKVATVSDTKATTFDVIDTASGTSVYSGNLGDLGYDASAVEGYKLADFSSVNTEGTYKIVTDTGAESYEFQIQTGVYDDLYKDVILMLYKQRCGTEIESSIAGDYAHEACHTGEAQVYGTDTYIDVSGGWHDAGDYGRYVVPGAKTIADLFLAYEDSEAAKTDSIGIPESGNGVPDLLDEARYELEWMLKMQDSASGGVYHKVTCAVFPETVMPEEETDQLILSPISNTATGDFAAVMAKASVLYAEYDADFAAKCLAAAENAWTYLEAHEGDKGFTNPDEIETGEYADNSDSDEYLWAAVELYIATKNADYKTFADEKIGGTKPVSYDLGWAAMGYYALYDYCKYIGANTEAEDILIAGAESVIGKIDRSGYGASLYNDFPWGSNMSIANNGMLLLMANEIAPNEQYVEYAKFQLDYLLGRNSVGYCYVTGYGTQSPLDPHHRPSQVLEQAMPGMLVGGADSNLEDPYAQAVLTGYAAESCYVDNAQSFSCNEITIYWNSPLIYLLSELK